MPGGHGGTHRTISNWLTPNGKPGRISGDYGGRRSPSLRGFGGRHMQIVGFGRMTSSVTRSNTSDERSARSPTSHLGSPYSIENYFGIVGSRQGRLRTPWPPSGHLWLGAGSSLHYDHHFNALFRQFRKMRFEPSTPAPIEMLRALHFQKLHDFHPLMRIYRQSIQAYITLSREHSINPKNILIRYQAFHPLRNRNRFENQRCLGSPQTGILVCRRK